MSAYAFMLSGTKNVVKEGRTTEVLPSLFIVREKSATKFLHFPWMPKAPGEVVFRLPVKTLWKFGLVYG